ncbi:hypothetical protein [Thermoactinospora rubra]|uniref:hypothetical protein n=1 Tax=Thermoactinospora rubra TaxID=1088767 RepID=UPI000A108718|nr:hypothetical protein [Thermoactinospora rubra]
MPSRQPETPAQQAMRPVSMPWYAPEVPEFETWVDDAGRLYGRHRCSGAVIEADTLDDLHAKAAVERIAHAWKLAWDPR